MVCSVLVNMLDTTQNWEPCFVWEQSRVISQQLLAPLLSSQSWSKSIYLTDWPNCVPVPGVDLGLLAGTGESHYTDLSLSLSLSLIFATADTFLHQQARSNLTDTDLTNISTSHHRAVLLSPSQTTSSQPFSGCLLASSVERALTVNIPDWRNSRFEDDIYISW